MIINKKKNENENCTSSWQLSDDGIIFDTFIKRTTHKKIDKQKENGK